MADTPVDGTEAAAPRVLATLTVVLRDDGIATTGSAKSDPFFAIALLELAKETFTKKLLSPDAGTRIVAAPAGAVPRFPRA